MRIYVLSDLHLEFVPFTPPKVDPDVVVLAGDTDLKLRGIRWAIDSFPDKPVIYVFGNHEFYGEKWPRLIEKGRALAAGTNVRILENDTWEIDGWRFFGATLWSDFFDHWRRCGFESKGRSRDDGFSTHPSLAINQAILTGPCP